MGALSFSKSLENVFPTQVGGCEINSDFRVILLIMRILGDPEIALYEKLEDACYYFYVDDTPGDAVEKMFDFIRAGAAPEDNGEPPQMDFEFDADEIYSDVLSLYGIDLLTADLHWYKFLALLGGVMAHEGALSSKIQTRFLKIDDLRGEERMKAQRAKERVQIPVRMTLEEILEAQQCEDEWGSI